MSQLDLFAPLPEFNGAAPAVTAPSVPGQVVGLPSEPCLFPQPWFFPPVFLGTGGDVSLDEYRPEFRFSVVTGAFGIDAPSRLPAGGHRLIDLGRIAIVEPSCGRA